MTPRKPVMWGPSPNIEDMPMEDAAKDQREEAAMSGVHPSHKTRFSDASSFDEVCVKCGATDILNGGWGELANPCSKEHSEEERWATPSSPSEAEWIKGASIRYADGRTVCEDDATRHEQLLGKHGIERDYIDGFLTNTGRFVDRMEAARIAFAAGQIPEPVPELYSEDLSRGMHRMPSEAEELAKRLEDFINEFDFDDVRSTIALLRKQEEEKRELKCLVATYANEATEAKAECSVLQAEARKQAERIRELERRNDTLHHNISNYREAAEENPKLAEVITNQFDELQTLRAQLAAAQERAERLAEALEPFGDIDGEGTGDYPDGKLVTVTCGRSTHYELRLGDLRRARAALAEEEKE